jgi:hypothetical protein
MEGQHESGFYSMEFNYHYRIWLAEEVMVTNNEATDNTFLSSYMKAI